MISTYNATQTRGDVHTLSLNETQISQCHNIKVLVVFLARSLSCSLPLPHSVLVSIQELSVAYACRAGERSLTF